MTRPLTSKDIAGFFLPLVLWAQLMMVTHSVIHAWLARQSNPTLALAGFAIAFALNGLFNSAFRSLHQVVLGFADQRGSYHRVTLFASVLAVVNLGVVLAVAHTALGEWVYGTVMGAGPKVVAEAQAASGILAFIFPLQMVRNLSTGLLMVSRRTPLITMGTAIRLGTLWVFLLLFAPQIDGARLGAAALVACIGVESVFATIVAWPVRRRLRRSGTPAPYAGIVRFALPLMINAALENAMVVVVNMALGRLHQADLALASFAVARGLLMIMTSPLRNMAQTAQALARTPREVRTVRHFALGASLAFMGIIVAIFYTPLRDVLLSDVMGLGAELRAAIVPGLLLFVAAPACWTTAALYRGLLAGVRRTGVLALTGLVRLSAVGAVALAGLVMPDINGAALGVTALAAGFATEGLLLRYRYRTLAAIEAQGGTVPAAGS